MEFEVLNYFKNRVHGVFSSGSVESQWFLTGVYGPPVACDRLGFWRLLRSLQIREPWAIIGNFNEILLPFENKVVGTGQKGKWVIFKICFLNATLVT